MNNLNDFSKRLELPNIPEGPGVCIIEDAQGQVLQVAASNNVRRRIGQFLDSTGETCSYGPKVYQAHQEGHPLFIRWKLTPYYKNERMRLIEELNPLWTS